MGDVVPLAPRYDARIVEAILALDDRAQPIAETCRRVGTVATKLELPRPSYVHVRRIVLAARELADEEQRRRQELRAIAADVAGKVLTGRIPDAYAIEQRVQRANERAQRRLDRKHL